MELHPLDRQFGHLVETDIKGVSAEQRFLAHLQIAADDAVAADDDGVAVISLGAEAQTVKGVNNPAVARALQIVCSNASMTSGNVVVTGKNMAGETITETLALNGTTARHGSKAFKTITSIAAPAGLTTAVKQVETATAAGTVTSAGDITVTVTSALFEENEAIEVAVEADDDANAIAAAIRTALAANANIAANFAVSGEDAAVVLTALVAAANDTTLNIGIDAGDTGATDAATSANTTAGVAPDLIKVGWNDKLGIPYKLAHNTVLAVAVNNVRETDAPTVAVSATALESNTVDPHTALAGQVVDIYLIA